MGLSQWFEEVNLEIFKGNYSKIRQEIQSTTHDNPLEILYAHAKLLRIEGQYGKALEISEQLNV